MKQPSFLEGVGVALVAALLGSVLHTALSPIGDGDGLLRLLIAGLGLGYIVYLLIRSPERVGRITSLVGWGLAAVAIWLLQPSLPLFLLVHLGLIWLVRSLYFYAGLLSALADLVLTGLGLAAGIWAATHTASLFLGLWCFFLVQALFVAIPAAVNRDTAAGLSHQASEDPFHYAHRAAESALRRLSSLH